MPPMSPQEFEHRQRALDHNVFASAKNSQTQADSLRRIAQDLHVIKWAAVFAALMLLLMVIR